jgi:molybdopterin converting factor small subunit
LNIPLTASRHRRLSVETKIRVRYFAGARAAAGVAEESIQLDSAASVEAVLNLVRARHGQPLATVLTRCSFLLDGVAVHDHAAAVSGRADLDVLPPFAGG